MAHAFHTGYFKIGGIIAIIYHSHLIGFGISDADEYFVLEQWIIFYGKGKKSFEIGRKKGKMDFSVNLHPLLLPLKTVTYILSNLDKALAFEWIAEELDKSKFQLRFILLNPSNSSLEDYFRECHIPVERVTYRGKKDVIPALYKTWKILRKWKPDIVHCHLLEASLIGLTAAKFAGVKERIYTRHYSSFHHVYFPTSVWLDKYLNFIATRIVAISQVVYDILVHWEKTNPKKVKVIHHGFRLNEFTNVSEDQKRSLHKKYNLEGKKPVIGVISRYTIWKGIQFTIPAFGEILKKYPNACLVLANAHGEYDGEIKKLLSTLPKESFREIRFESNLGALYNLFDIFIHVPIDEHSEAFGQVYVEALAAGIPSIFTNSGIAVDIAIHEQNSLVVDFKSIDMIADNIERLLEDQALADKLIAGGKSTVEKFELKKMIVALENLYSR